MDTRRDFLKKAILLSGATGLSYMIPESIRKAMAINPEKGSTYLDAEHIVILMQENRSFDHCFGTLKGVRGFNDPRAMRMPNKNLVWMQSNEKGETYSPFRFDIRNTKATWMGSTPHSRSSQVDAWNAGKYDNWLSSKRVRDKRYADIPLTMGYYTREDIPFYYAMADAFTVCDQNFCSAMTSTNPNRLFSWAGTVKEEQTSDARAIMRNLSNDRWGVLQFDTFPERLEDNGISWKFYQNDIDCGGGFTGDERAWLSNFGCNPLEWFASYNVKFSPRYIKSLQNQVISLPDQIKELEDKIQSQALKGKALSKAQAAVAKKKEALENARKDLLAYTAEQFDKLSAKEKNLFQRAFTDNSKDPDYHNLTDLTYNDNGVERQLAIPKGDVLFQFRKDVESGKLPTVSWIAAAQNLSDHPSAPWYGSLYASEILSILTKNPEVWKKTIFIVNFDENDGYFDHVLPFVAPDPLNVETGRCSPRIDSGLEYVRLENELRDGIPEREARGGPIGLGFRVPMLIASPWSRGGRVCSEVFDHTSVLQFLEVYLKGKLGKEVSEKNISNWRRTITGDLTSVFKPYRGEAAPEINFLDKKPFLEKIYNAKFKKDELDFKKLSQEEIDNTNKNPASSSILPTQEQGIKSACALPYQIYADGKLSSDKGDLILTLSAKNEFFGKKSSGCPFNILFPGKYAANKRSFENVGSRSYAVAAGNHVSETFPLRAFEDGIYQLEVNGPNGFYRYLSGDAGDPSLFIICEYERPGKLINKATGNIELKIFNSDPYEIEIRDNAYKNKIVRKALKPQSIGNGEAHTIILNLNKSFGWYDFTVSIKGFDRFKRRYAGHVETGQESFTDPFMGRV
ncbi:MAG TPA: phospholipase C, phosphocholine-specific [Hanamia sp.]|nr:phospholipase C, phosphocholine-specific [Hanamia sp.]